MTDARTDVQSSPGVIHPNNGQHSHQERREEEEEEKTQVQLQVILTGLLLLPASPGEIHRKQETEPITKTALELYNSYSLYPSQKCQTK